jgi:hypothetical protein
MDYKLRDGKWSKLLQYEQLLIRTGMEPQHYSAARQPQQGPEITLDIMAFGTCRDLEATVKLALDGEVVAAKEAQVQQ